MVKEGIVLGHKISRKGIEVDKAKVDVISKLPHPTTVKGIEGAVLGQRIEKHFRPIHYASKTMTEAETNYTTTEKEMLAVVWICQISQEISQKRTRERMSDQEAKDLKAEAREIMPQPSTSSLIPSWNWMAAMVSRGFRAEGQLIG
ncbi:retrovirus-related pol polyprotein from transposon 17.6 [Tanacetum coccineum]